MRFRKLRIAWSVGLGLSCVLLIVLWVRSHQRMDITDRSSAINICSMNGQLLFGENLMLLGRNNLLWQKPILVSRNGFCSLSQEDFEIIQLGGGVIVHDSYLIAGFAVLSAAPWFPWHFSLRTLLIATTLVAVVLGLAFYAASK